MDRLEFDVAPASETLSSRYLPIDCARWILRSGNRWSIAILRPASAICQLIGCMFEHAYSFISECDAVLRELKGKHIRVIGIGDYDHHGGLILQAHADWLLNTFAIEMINYGLNRSQVESVELDPDEDHQLDGWLALYRPANFISDMKRICHIE